MSLKELQLPSIASLRAIAALRSPHLALVRPARIGLGFESVAANQKTLADVEATLGGPGRLSLPYSMRWLLDVLTGLGVLHRTLGFVHGEVQPEHVVLGEDGVGRLVPVVRAHWVRGEQRAPERLYYLAPEKLLGDSLDVRSDVFSVGVMLWEALAGQPLLQAANVDDIIARLMGGGIPRARAPEREEWTVPLAEIAERAIAVDPGRRFSSVAEMKEVLDAACRRYLASAPGMAEVFQNPQRHVRRQPDSPAPDSQRVTLPPIPAEPSTGASIANNATVLDAAAERLARSSFAPLDLEDEHTTRPRASAEPPLRTAHHVNTLLGVPLPHIEQSAASHASMTSPFARTPSSTAAKVVISAGATPSAAPPSRMLAASRLAPAAVPLQVTVPARAAAASAAASAESTSALVAQPARRAAAVEPSFELVRPRKDRGALWLLLGAAAAIGIFAARPWLTRQVAAATGRFSDTGEQGSQVQQAAPAVVATPRASGRLSAATADPAQPVAIASTPPSPSQSISTARPALVPRQRHAVIDDRLEPTVSQPPPLVPNETPLPAETRPEPAAEPPPPAPPPKIKPPPVSDADRYGI